jgi:agmatinase
MTSPRTHLPNPRQNPRFAGVATFARFPLIESVLDDHHPVDWAVYGVPFDSGVTYRPGARFGPRAIRAESQYVKPYHLEHNVTITDVLSLADAGDAPVRPYDCQENARVVADFASHLGTPRHTRLLALGGDHSIALSNLRATHKRRGLKTPLALVHFDSHLDTIDSVWDEKYGHASPFIRAVEEGLIDPARMISIGIKGPLNTPRDLDYARDHGVTIVTADQACAQGNEQIDAFLRRIGDSELYLTFDIDCVDPAFAPGTGTPSVGGLSSAQTLALLRRLAHGGGTGRPPNIVGADVVEVLPDRDVAGITALLAAHIAFEVLALAAKRAEHDAARHAASHGSHGHHGR